MASRGTITRHISRNNAFSGIIEWTSTQNVARNETTITARFYLKSNYGNALIRSTAPKAFRMTIDGQAQSATTHINNLGAFQKKQIGPTVTKTVRHNANGAKSVNIGISFYMGISGVFMGTLGFSRTVSLDRIAAASSISSITGGVLGQPMVVNISRRNSSIKHDIYWTGLDRRRIRLSSGVDTRLTFTPSLAAHSAAIPNATSGMAKIEVVSKSGSTTVGTTSRNVRLTVPKKAPSLAQSVSHVGRAPSGFGFTRSLSKMQIRSTITAHNGAKIASVITKVNGETFSHRGSNTITTGFLLWSGNNRITWEIIDTRGYRSTFSRNIATAPYTEPRVSLSNIRRANSNGTENSQQGTYLHATIDASINPAGGKNSMIQRGIQYRRQGSSTWITASVSTSGRTTVFLRGGFNTGYAYQLRGYARDKYQTTYTGEYRLDSAFVLMNFHKSGRGLGIGTSAEKENHLRIAMPTDFSAEVMIQGKKPINTGQIASGSYAVPGGSGKRTTLRVNFGKTFSKVPKVAIGVRSVVAGTIIKTWGIGTIDTKGFTANVERTTATNSIFDWIAYIEE